jgi:hypothetical protein
VFVGGGRSDLYVQANAVGLDGTSEVFVAELKFWKGKQTLLAAVNQALENLTQRTLSALLIVPVRDRESFSDSVRTGHEVLVESGATIAPSLANQSIYELPSRIDPNVQVRLAVIYVDLTAPRGSRRKRSPRKS